MTAMETFTGWPAWAEDAPGLERPLTAKPS
jgi:hypothetical protein